MDDAPTQEIPAIGGRVGLLDDPSRSRSAVTLLARLGSRPWLFVAIALVILAFGATGALIAFDVVDFRGEWRFDLDGETTIPAFFSAALLVWAGVSLGVVAMAIRDIALGAIGALLTYMAFDEVYGLHEDLETLTGISWQLLYLPIAAGAGIAFLLVVERLRRARVFLPCWALAAGSAAWVIAQGLEKLEWEGDVAQPGYLPMMVSEEILEMIGSFSFLVAAFALAGAAARDLLMAPRHRRTR